MVKSGDGFAYSLEAVVNKNPLFALVMLEVMMPCIHTRCFNRARWAHSSFSRETNCGARNERADSGTRPRG